MDRDAKLIEMLTNLFESQQQAEYDFCGDQREWHLPRLNKAAATAVVLFPSQSFIAMRQAKDPYGKKLSD